GHLRRSAHRRARDDHAHAARARISARIDCTVGCDSRGRDQQHGHGEQTHGFHPPLLPSRLTPLPESKQSSSGVERALPAYGLAYRAAREPDLAAVLGDARRAGRAIGVGLAVRARAGERIVYADWLPRTPVAEAVAAAPARRSRT